MQLSARVAQSGAFAGVRNTLNTVWLPAGRALDALDGRVVLSSNGPGFSEALVQLGTTLDGQAACRARDGSVTPDIPPNRRIWAGILKNDGEGSVQQPVHLQLPHALPWSNDRGACLLTIVSAGYPFLSASRPLYTTTELALSARLTALAAHGTPRAAAAGRWAWGGSSCCGPAAGPHGEPMSACAPRSRSSWTASP